MYGLGLEVEDELVAHHQQHRRQDAFRPESAARNYSVGIKSGHRAPSAWHHRTLLREKSGRWGALEEATYQGP